jgi:hypothetical protein
MIIVNRRSRVCFVACAAALGATAAFSLSAEEFEQHHAHEHGKITINVALEKRELSIELDAPADNVIGFEHAPRTEAERQAVHDALLLLRNAQDLFGLPSAAQCRVTGSDISSPHWEAEPTSAHDESPHEQHADYEGRFTYRCEAPRELTWLEPWILDKLRGVHEARINLITPSGQRSQIVTRARERISFR